MTNEEIEKRFNFDLELGVFGNDKDVYIWVDGLPPIDKIRLMTVLNEIGIEYFNQVYSFEELKNYIFKRDHNIICLSIDTKSYTFIFLFKFESGHQTKFEECVDLPEYIKEYKLE